MQVFSRACKSLLHDLLAAHDIEALAQSVDIIAEEAAVDAVDAVVLCLGVYIYAVDSGGCGVVKHVFVVAAKHLERHCAVVVACYLSDGLVHELRAVGVAVVERCGRGRLVGQLIVAHLAILHIGIELVAKLLVRRHCRAVVCLEYGAKLVVRAAGIDRVC